MDWHTCLGNMFLPLKEEVKNIRAFQICSTSSLIFFYGKETY